MNPIETTVPDNPPAGRPDTPSIAILMGTMQGEAYLAEQLDSIAAQDHAQWTLWVSDDGSTDGTLALLDQYKLRWGAQRLRILPGPRKGFAANFLSLVCNPAIEADYFAFADQDDIWEPSRLSRGLARLQGSSQSSTGAGPAMYCARTRLIDAQGREIGMSWLFRHRPTFRNALAQNIGGGNTMLVNHATISLMRQIGPDLAILNHDWWTYMLVIGTGGQVIYDPVPSVRYRQHGSNAVGSNLGLLARMVRARLVMQGRLKSWNDQNTSSLAKVRHYLTAENARIFDEFCLARQGSLPHRAWHLWKSGIYRQQLSGNLGIVVALMFDQL